MGPRVSAQHGKPSTSGRGPITPASAAAHCGLRWSNPGQGTHSTLTWDQVVDLAYVAYWDRRPDPRLAATTRLAAVR